MLELDIMDLQHAIMVLKREGYNIVDKWKTNPNTKKRYKEYKLITELENIKCDVCGYQNHRENVDRYGTCKLCGKTLDEKAKYKYEMFCRLKMWRGEKNGI